MTQLHLLYMAWQEKIRVGISHNSVACINTLQRCHLRLILQIPKDQDRLQQLVQGVLGNGSHFCATSNPPQLWAIEPITTVVRSNLPPFSDHWNGIIELAEEVVKYRE